MTVPHPYAGKSIIEIIWEELDAVMDKLMSDGEPSKVTFVRSGYESSSLAQAREEAEVWWEALRSWGEERGQAQGLAYALAVLTNPYHVDVDAIRATAVQHWKERNNG